MEWEMYVPFPPINVFFIFNDTHVAQHNSFLLTVSNILFRHTFECCI